MPERVDGPGRGGYPGHMVLIRHMLCLLLVLAVLPWGAWSGAHGPAQGIAHAVAAPADQALPPPPDTAIKAVKRCRGPALPGAPCGLDIAPAAETPAPAPAAGPASAWLARVQVRGTGLPPPGFLDPPILA